MAVKKKVNTKKEDTLHEKVKKFKLDAFPYELVIVVSESPTESRRRRNHIFGYYIPDDDTAAIHASLPGYSMIFIKYHACIGQITHEIFHFVWQLMEYIGANHNNEVMAYYNGHYVKETARFCYEASLGRTLPKHIQGLSGGLGKKKG